MQHHTLCILLIENPMGMHGVVPAGEVLQVHDNYVINLCSKYGSQEAQPGRSGGLVLVCSICILSVHGLLVNSANTVGSTFQEPRCMPEIAVERGHK